MTVLCQRHELPGFSTQWPSSGNVRSFRGHALDLQRREELKALAERHAVVALAGDDEQSAS